MSIKNLKPISNQFVNFIKFMSFKKKFLLQNNTKNNTVAELNKSK